MTAMQTIRPCLWFKDQAEEAARFYVSVFPDSRIDEIIHHSGESPGGKAGGVLLVEFTLAGQKHQALNGATEAFNDAISLSVQCANQQEIDHYWSALTAEGGRPVQCGWLKDRYGVSWQIVPTEAMAMLRDPDRRKAGRVIDAVGEMIKLDIDALRQAYNRAD